MVVLAGRPVPKNMLLRRHVSARDDTRNKCDNFLETISLPVLSSVGTANDSVCWSRLDRRRPSPRLDPNFRGQSDI
jgi:hypothetical protein